MSKPSPEFPSPLAHDILNDFESIMGAETPWEQEDKPKWMVDHVYKIEERSIIQLHDINNQNIDSATLRRITMKDGTLWLPRGFVSASEGSWGVSTPRPEGFTIGRRVSPGDTRMAHVLPGIVSVHPVEAITHFFGHRHAQSPQIRGLENITGNTERLHDLHGWLARINEQSLVTSS